MKSQTSHQKFRLNIFLYFVVIYAVYSNKVKISTQLSKCGALCMECSDNDPNSCQSCNPGVFQYNNNCFNTCPEGTFPDKEWQICRDCDSNCPVCWGPNSNNCGTVEGVKTRVVLLENEIKEYFNKTSFDQGEINEWLQKVELICGKIPDKGIPTRDNEVLSTDDVYNTNKVEVSLPIGSFSRKNGVFVPIPSYLDKDSELVKSHWIFKKGSWDGHSWNDEWYPRVPSFIKTTGDKNKIYIENRGYWYYVRGQGM